MTLLLFQFFLSESISVIMAIITLLFALFVSQTIITRDVVAQWSRHRAGRRLIASSNPTPARYRRRPCGVAWMQFRTLMVEYINEWDTIFLFEDYCSTSLFPHILFLLVSKGRHTLLLRGGRQPAGVRSPPTPTPKRLVPFSIIQYHTIFCTILFQIVLDGVC
jgi:hypothetical protein